MRTSLFRLATSGLLVLGAVSVLAAPPKHTKAMQKSGKKTTGKAKAAKTVTTKTGLKYQDLKVGTGPMPKIGQKVTVNYVGTFANGKKFDASRDHGGTFSFNLGTGVIQGWSEGVATMRVGGKRRLIVPPSLGYGPNDYGPIPGNSTLYFDIDLLKVE